MNHCSKALLLSNVIQKKLGKLKIEFMRCLFWPSLFRDVLDEILNLIESVSMVFLPTFDMNNCTP